MRNWRRIEHGEGGRKGVSGGMEEEMNAAPVPSFCLKQGLDKQEVQLHSLVSCPCDSRSFFPSIPQPRHLPPRTHEKNNSIFPEPCLLNCFSNLSEQHLATVKERRMEREREKKKKRCETRKQIWTNAVRGVPQPSRRGAKSHDSWQSGHAVPLSGP